jgi:hypothetical protein
MDQVCEETGEGGGSDQRSSEWGSKRLYYKTEAGPHIVTVETLVGEKIDE